MELRKSRHLNIDKVVHFYTEVKAHIYATSIPRVV